MAPSPCIIHGNCLQVLAAMPAACVDSIVTDPPYELGFMGKKWDGSGIAYSVELWTEALRVLKPGGHLLAFGGTRTSHRMVCAIEDAGFEIRDSIQWIYGSGFPKSHNLKGDRAGWGTALKPAHEPIVVARKPLGSTVAACVLEHGTGALNIDGCRIGTADSLSRPFGSGGDHLGQLNAIPRGTVNATHTAGRWPANVVFDEDAAAELDRQSGTLISGASAADVRVGMGYHGATGDGGPAIEANVGGASRFFYVAKPSKRERNAGLHHLPEIPAGSLAGGNDTRDGRDRPQLTPRANVHPTVKPLTLMRYLVRLVTPPGGVVLDPFAGSGTTLMAATLEGHDSIGIELTAEYLPIIQGRTAWAVKEWQTEQPALFVA